LAGASAFLSGFRIQEHNCGITPLGKSGHEFKLIGYWYSSGAGVLMGAFDGLGFAKLP